MADGAIFPALEFREHYHKYAPYGPAEYKRSERLRAHISRQAFVFREMPRHMEKIPARAFSRLRQPRSSV